MNSSLCFKNISVCRGVAGPGAGEQGRKPWAGKGVQALGGRAGRARRGRQAWRSWEAVLQEGKGSPSRRWHFVLRCSGFAHPLDRVGGGLGSIWGVVHHNLPVLLAQAAQEGGAGRVRRGVLAALIIVVCKQPVIWRDRGRLKVCSEGVGVCVCVGGGVFQGAWHSPEHAGWRGPKLAGTADTLGGTCGGGVHHHLRPAGRRGRGVPQAAQGRSGCTAYCRCRCLRLFAQLSRQQVQQRARQPVDHSPKSSPRRQSCSGAREARPAKTAAWAQTAGARGRKTGRGRMRGAGWPTFPWSASADVKGRTSQPAPRAGWPTLPPSNALRPHIDVRHQRTALDRLGVQLGVGKHQRDAGGLLIPAGSVAQQAQRLGRERRRRAAALCLCAALCSCRPGRLRPPFCGLQQRLSHSEPLSTPGPGWQLTC